MPGSSNFFQQRHGLPCGIAALTLCTGMVWSEDRMPVSAEKYGDEAAVVLKQLTEPLETGNSPSEEWEEHFAPGFMCGSLRPGKPLPAWNGPEAAVLRLTGDGKTAIKGPGGLLQEFRSFPKTWGQTTGRHVKFKIVRVDASALPAVKTRQLFSFIADTPSGPAEHNATWETEWETTPDSTAEHPELRLKSLRCLSAEEARAKKGAWLSDCTASVFAGVEEFQSQLCRGNVWWRARLQKQFEQFVYGHHGLAVGDANGDGLDDVYLCMEGGLPNRLYLQQPDGTVKDASHELGVDYLDHTRSALFVDLDSDGDEDLVLAISRGILLLENTGARGFVQKALLPRVTDCFSLAAADYDGNGTIDFYGCGYRSRDADPARVAWPVPFYDAQNGGEDFLVRNEGNWRFTNATDETGLGKNNNRFSFAAVWTDFDNDGDPDLAVANDFGKNNLFEQRRDAAGRITFVDVAAERGLANSAFGMSISTADFNHDGALDFYIGNMFSSAGNRITNQPEFKKGLAPEELERFRVLANGNGLFLNNGKGQFTDHGAEAGVSMGRWTWGTLAADLNCDGWEDVLVANGNITGHSKAPDL